MPPPTKPVVEAPPQDEGQSEIDGRALQQRIRQQELLAELGVTALRGTPFLELINHTVRIGAEGLGAELCKVLEYIPSENRLLMRAGVGWHEGLIGVATVGADLASPSGYALRTGKPVISNHLGERAAIQDAGTPCGAWRPTGHKRHLAGRRDALRGA